MLRIHTLLPAVSAFLMTCSWVSFTSAQSRSVRLRQFEPVILESEVTTSANASLLDVDGDDDLDIFLARGRHWPVLNRILLNDGNAKFQPIEQAWPADKTYSAIVADFNQDGFPDLATSNDRPNQNNILLNDGKGNFAISGTWGDSAWPTRNACAADLDNDGAMDLVAANRKRPSFICFNDGDGGFDTQRTLALPIQSATTIIPGDFNNDGFVDLILPHRDGGQSVICWNDSEHSFTQTTAFGPATANCRTGNIGDLNQDGWLDFVAGDQNKGVVIYLNENGTLNKARQFKYQGKRPYSIALADMNQDGNLDIVVGYASSEPNDSTAMGRVLLLPDNIEDEQENVVTVPFAITAGAIYGLALGDVNADGFIDIVAARSGGNNALFLNLPTTK